MKGHFFPYGNSSIWEALESGCQESGQGVTFGIGMRHAHFFIKRLFDVLFSFAFLFLALPVLVLTALLAYFIQGPPLFFVQMRAGQHGHPFKIYKFRTMLSSKSHAHADAHASTVTPLGKFLRRWSLDEVPSLVNVLNGNMSLVGPRPLLIEYVSEYSAHQRRRLEMKPGITGLAQVEGRNSLSWDEKFERDIWYIDHWSLGLDLSILLRTFGTVIRGKGIQADTQVTMPLFRRNALPS